MSKKHAYCPVSSTPHPKKISPQPNDLFGCDDVLSPIVQPAATIVSTKESQQSKKPLKKAAIERDLKVLKKKKCVPKDKECASSEVLKELGVTSQDLCRNGLSTSRNMYNMFPEPIVLDSDEEDLILSKSNIKMPLQNNKSNLRPDKKTKVSVSTKIKDTENVGRRKDLNSVKNMEHTRTSSRRKKDIPLSNCINIQEQKRKNTNKETRPKQYPTPEEASPSIIVLDNNSIFQENLIPENKSVNIQFKLKDTIFEELSEVELNWTPRLKKIETEPNLITNTDSNPALVEGGTGNYFDEIKNTQVCKNIQVEKKATRKRKRTHDVCLQDSKKEKAPKEEDLNNDNCHLYECFFPFEKVIFRRNDHSGGIVGKSFQNNSMKFGYVEIEKNEMFTGKSPDVTFVLLEGQVKSKYLNSTVIMKPGDIIYIKTESEYQFKAVGQSHSRFLYVKNHR